MYLVGKWGHKYYILQIRIFDQPGIFGLPLLSRHGFIVCAGGGDVERSQAMCLQQSGEEACSGPCCSLALSESIIFETLILISVVDKLKEQLWQLTKDDQVMS